MAKSKHEYWLTKDGQILLRGWAREGLTDEQIANNMGISRSTLAKWKNEISDISDTISAGKEISDFEIENALFESAKNGNFQAQQFWLKNRKPKVWRDKQETEITGKNGDDLQINLIL